MDPIIGISRKIQFAVYVCFALYPNVNFPEAFRGSSLLARVKVVFTGDPTSLQHVEYTPKSSTYTDLQDIY